jgi:hypothetical protein
LLYICHKGTEKSIQGTIEVQNIEKQGDNKEKQKVKQSVETIICIEF